VPTNNWLQNKIIPLLYQQYPLDDNIKIEGRNVTQMGTIPLKAVSVYNNDPGVYQLTPDAIQAGSAPAMSGRFRIMYFLSYVTYQDYRELLSKAVAKYLTGNRVAVPAPIQQLLATPFPDLEANQQYGVEVSYRLPGTNTVTSTVNYNILYR
jgi:hypothetical protein